MSLTTGPLFSAMQSRLAWVDQRQRLLAEDIANADTPGYRARDVAPFSAVLDHAAVVTPLRSSPRDLPAILAAPAAARTIPGSASVDTNLGKLADTEGAQSLVINLYGAYLGMFRTALGVGGNAGS